MSTANILGVAGGYVDGIPLEDPDIFFSKPNAWHSSVLTGEKAVVFVCQKDFTGNNSRPPTRKRLSIQKGSISVNQPGPHSVFKGSRDKLTFPPTAYLGL